MEARAMAKYNWDVTQFLKEDNGSFSGMRLMAIVIIVSACYVALINGVAIATAISSGKAIEPAVIGNVAGLVGSMITAALGMKAWQKKSEEKGGPGEQTPLK
jgi:hypothetical protein